MAGPVVKRCFHVERVDELARVICEAHACASEGEPGPVLLEIDAGLARTAAHATPIRHRSTRRRRRRRPVGRPAEHRADIPSCTWGRARKARRRRVRALAERLNAPVLCTSSGRGVLPDTDPRLFVQDFSTGLGTVVPDLIERSDLVLALGCKFTHNGSAGGTTVAARAQAGPGRRVPRSARCQLPGETGHRSAGRGRTRRPGVRDPGCLAVECRRTSMHCARGCSAKRRSPSRSSRRCRTPARRRFAPSSRRSRRRAAIELLYVTDAGLHQAVDAPVRVRAATARPAVPERLPVDGFRAAGRDRRGDRPFRTRR